MKLQSFSNQLPITVIGPGSTFNIVIDKLLTLPCYSLSLLELQVPKRVNSGCYSAVVLLTNESEKTILQMH